MSQSCAIKLVALRCVGTNGSMTDLSVRVRVAWESRCKPLNARCMAQVTLLNRHKTISQSVLVPVDALWQQPQPFQRGTIDPTFRPRR